MRWGLACALALLILVPAATGAAPLVSIQATPAAGAAPLHVTFTAAGDAASYHWDFGDGGSADGQTVEHTYAAGRWTATLTARSADGDDCDPDDSGHRVRPHARRAQPRAVRPSRRLPRRDRRRPSAASTSRSSGRAARSRARRTRADGSYAVAARIKLPVSTSRRASAQQSAPLALRVVPKLVTRLSGSGARDSRYVFTARLVPAERRCARGEHRARPGRPRRPHLRRAACRSSSTRSGSPRTGSATEVDAERGLRRHGPRRCARTSSCRGSPSVHAAPLSHSSAPSCARLHYAAPSGGTFDGRMLDAVYAFQKVHGLPRTGVVDARFWRALANPRHADPALRAARRPPRGEQGRCRCSTSSEARRSR